MGPRCRAVATVAVSLAAVIVSMGRPSGIAVADDKVVLGGGAGIAVNGDLCTLATIGHDSAGALVGFTSAHCGSPGAPVAAEGQAGPIGSVVAADDGLDYAVIKFDPAKVAPIPDFDGFAINGIGPDPGFGQGACIQSRASGRTCTYFTAPAVGKPSAMSLKTPWQPDDDGAPVTANDLLVGMIRDGRAMSLNVIPTRPLVVVFSAILNDVNAKGGPGAGFSPIPA
jgi:hypothetical protein